MKSLVSLTCFSVLAMSACGGVVTRESAEVSSVSDGVRISRQPVCANVGTKGEGWYVDGFPIVWAKCEKKILACMKSGTADEGWYEVTPADMGLLRFGFCSEESSVPQCTAIGSRSEGFSGVDAQGVSWRVWGQCTDRVAVCYNIGNRAEGWYSLRPESPMLLLRTRCAGVGG